MDITPEACAWKILEEIPPVMRFLRAEMRRRGAVNLTIPQFRTMFYLQRCPNSSLSDVAEHLSVSRPTASLIIERLVQRGLVERRADPQELRRVLLNLTDIGDRHLRQVRAETHDKIAELLDGLSPEEIFTIHQGISLLTMAFLDVKDPPAKQDGING